MEAVIYSGILLLTSYGVVDGSPGVNLREAPLSVTELSQAKDCTVDDYHDIRNISFLRFSAGRTAHRKHHSIGDNAALQCQDPKTCSYSGYPQEASCYNHQVNKLSNPMWVCETTFPDSRYSFGSTTVSCEILSETMEFCGLKESCILLYVPVRGASILLGFALTTMSMSSMFCLLAVLCSIRRQGAVTRQATSISNGLRAEQFSYDPNADPPPSYSSVLRNPQYFEKPNENIAKPALLKAPTLSESPPPPYATCSGEE